VNAASRQLQLNTSSTYTHRQMAPFTIRKATLDRGDPELFVDMMDSQIPWLSSIGSSGQWGSLPIREARPNIVSRPQDWIKRSEEQKAWCREWCRAFVAEVPAPGEMDTKKAVPAAALVLETVSASYVRDLLPEQDEADPFVYVAFIMSNRRVAEASKGAGAALLEVARQQAQEVGVRRICLDCYAGNERKLIRYYQSQGFKLIGDFKSDEKEWPGAVLELRL